MAEKKHKGSWWALTEQGVQWDAQGKPYYNTSDGMKNYISPVAAAQYHDDPKMLEWAAKHGSVLTDTGITNTDAKGASLFKEHSQWDSQTGDYKQPINWGNIMAMGVGGAMAAPFVAGALGSTALGGAASIPTTAGIADATALGLPVTAGLGTAGTAGTVAGAAAAGSVLPSTTIGTGAVPAITGGTGSAFGAAPLASTTIGTGAIPGITGGTGSNVSAAATNIARDAAGPTTNALLAGLTSSQGVAAGINAGTGLLGTYLNNKAAKNAAQVNADSLKYAADLQDAENKRAELFARQKAENQWLNDEITRHANYNQWASREDRVSNLGQAMGLSARNITPYAAGTDPRYTSDGTQPPPGTTPPGTTPGPTPIGLDQTEWFRKNPFPDGGSPEQQAQWRIEAAKQASGTGGGVAGSTGGGSSDANKPTRDALSAQFGNDPTTTALLDFYGKVGKTPTGEGSGPTDLAYFRKRIEETGGLTPDNLKYWFGEDGQSGRIAKELAGAVPAEGSKPKAAAYNAGTQDFQYKPFDYSTLAPAAQAPEVGSLAALLRQYGGR